jgi:APA family basic amino acid/polyamine antiporter
MAALIPIGEAADMTNIGTLFAFVLVCIGIMVLRYTKPTQPRPFRMPFMPIIPILGVLACLGLMYFLPWMTWIRFFVWTVIGIAVYMLYGIRHSKLALQPSIEPTSMPRPEPSVDWQNNRAKKS